MTIFPKKIGHVIPVIHVTSKVRDQEHPPVMLVIYVIILKTKKIGNVIDVVDVNLFRNSCIHAFYCNVT